MLLDKTKRTLCFVNWISASTFFLKSMNNSLAFKDKIIARGEHSTTVLFEFDLKILHLLKECFVYLSQNLEQISYVIIFSHKS